MRSPVLKYASLLKFIIVLKERGVREFDRISLVPLSALLKSHFSGLLSRRTIALPN